MTIASDWTALLEKFAAWAGDDGEKPVVIYRGTEARSTRLATITPWTQIADLIGLRGH